MRPSLKKRVALTLGVTVVLLIVLAAAVVPVRVGIINLGTWWAVRLAEDRGVWWQRMVDSWVPSGAVLVVGDSLAGQLPPRMVSGRVVVFGVGGALIEDAASYLRERKSLRRVSALVVIVGTNDLVHRTPEDSERALRVLLAALPPGLPVLLCTVPPVDSAVHRDRALAEITAWNERLRLVADNRANTSVLDLFRELADQKGALPPALHQGDGLHLSRAGYVRVAAAIRAALLDVGVR